MLQHLQNVSCRRAVDVAFVASALSRSFDSHRAYHIRLHIFVRFELVKLLKSVCVADCLEYVIGERYRLAVDVLHQMFFDTVSVAANLDSQNMLGRLGYAKTSE